MLPQDRENARSTQSKAPRASAPAPRERRYAPSMTAPLLVLAVFLLLLLVRFISPYIFDRENEVILLTVVQVLIFMLPAVIYLRLCRVSLRRLRPTPFGINHILLIVSAVIAATAGSLLLDLAASGYDAFSDTYTLYGAFSAPVGDGAARTLYLALVYAALPAFCEELVFRAILCAEYESDGGSFSAVVLTSLWFAMLHFDTRSFLVYFLAGMLLSLTLYATRSFFAAFAVHLGYDLIAVFGAPLFRTFYDAGGRTLYILILGVATTAALTVFCGECARLYGSYADRALDSSYRGSYSAATQEWNAEQAGSAPSVPTRLTDPTGQRTPNGQKRPTVPNAQSAPPESRSFGEALRRAFAGNVRAFLAPSALLCYLLYIAVILFLN